MPQTLDREKSKFASVTERSRETFRTSKLLTPFGVHSNYRYVDPYPIYFRTAKASRIRDVDGNEYLDFNM